MPITGSQKALMYALGGIARGGATRGGYVSSHPFVSTGGLQRATGKDNPAAKVLMDSLVINWVINSTPDTCTFEAMGFTPVVGQEVIITRGSRNSLTREFAGHIIAVDQSFKGKQANISHTVHAIDYTWGLDRIKVVKRYQSQSATTIAKDLISSFTTGYTSVNVEAGLLQIDEITFTNQDVTQALTNLAKRVGAVWYIDYFKDLHFYVTAETNYTKPQTLGPTLKTLQAFVGTRDLSQMVTRVRFEGGGANASAPVAVGASVLPVEDADWYHAAGGTVVSGPQRITYTGIVQGGEGSLVGTTVTPSNPPTVTKKPSATGLGTGDYKWGSTFVTASGETLMSPPTAAFTFGGATAPPSTAPATAKVLGGSLSAGAYQWKIAFVDADGNETLAGPASVAITMDDVAAPGTNGTADNHIGSLGAGSLDPSAVYSYKYTFANGSYETLPSAASNNFTTDFRQAGRLSRSGVQDAPVGFTRHFYRTVGGGTGWLRMAGPSNGFTYDDADYFYDMAFDGTLGVNAPTSNTAVYRSAALTNIPVSTDANISKRRIYRTAAGGSTFKKVADINDNTTTTYTDTLADASLGTTELSVATSLYKTAALSAIPIGPSGTTSRKVYRTVANGSTYKLLTTIADNTTQTYTDTTADGSLGATAPGSDTSGLVTQTGEVAEGSTSLLVTSTAPFLSSGGWAYIGALRIRYTGISGTSLTGIPASGDGALTTTVRYAVEVVAAAMLTGIPTSGAGSVVYPILQGDPVNLLVTVDDTDAQAALSLLVDPTNTLGGAAGIAEEYLQDRRISYAESVNRATARLSEANQVDFTIRYTSFDTNNRAGREVIVQFDPPTSLSYIVTIQRVTVTSWGPVKQPTYQVDASPNTSSPVDFLKLMARVGSVA